MSIFQAVEESLRSVNLLHGGAADKQVKKYSGGMKRRLSVAISLIGNPKVYYSTRSLFNPFPLFGVQLHCINCELLQQVVYMDEPSTGLDPASRNSLWNVVKHAKQDKAIILTSNTLNSIADAFTKFGVCAAAAMLLSPLSLAFGP